MISLPSRYSKTSTIAHLVMMSSLTQDGLIFDRNVPLFFYSCEHMCNVSF